MGSSNQGSLCTGQSGERLHFKGNASGSVHDCRTEGLGPVLGSRRMNPFPVGRTVKFDDRSV